MVMIYLMMRRRINLVRLILGFILTVVNAERRRHATLLYGMFLTRVFIRSHCHQMGIRMRARDP